MTRSLTPKNILAVVLAVVALTVLLPATALGATITVNSTSDASMGDGRCSLREAIMSANTDRAPFSGSGECASGSGADTIVLPAGTYTLSILGADEDNDTTGDLDISGPTTLVGAGAAVTTIDANHIDRAIQVMPGASVTIEGLTITGGRAPAGAPGTSASGPGPKGCGVSPGGSGQGGDGGTGEPGGGILNGGTLSIFDSVITGNAAGAGGAGGNGTGCAGATGTNGGLGGSGTGGKGGTGGNGGGIENLGGSSAIASLTLQQTVVTANAAGAGGAGGTGTGGAGASAGLGGDSAGGDGGPGGYGGAITQDTQGGPPPELTVEQSTIAGNAAGAGGAGGDALGGPGGSSAGALAGNGGRGSGGTAGPGGLAGGILALGRSTLNADLFLANVGGAGGRGGAGTGGAGGGDTASGGRAGNGGEAEGGAGGTGGNVGGFAAELADRFISDSNDTVSTNAGGAGGSGGTAVGGAGGGAFPSGTGGGGGSAQGGAAGGGGGDGGLELAGAAIVHATITSNTVGRGGDPGDANGGAGGQGATTGPRGVSAQGAPGTVGSVGAIVGISEVGLQNTIVAGNSLPSCEGMVLDGGHDIAFPDVTCPGANLDPRMAALADNGGPTQTQALEAGSPAIDAVPASGAGCAATDQRGVSRPQGGGCDIGAYEHAPPGVHTGTATGISANAATLAATVNPQARLTGYHFEYGTTSAYGSSTLPQEAAADLVPTSVSAAVSGLAPATTYHYRLVASNADGTTFGADETFTTARASGVGLAAGGPRFLSASVRPRVFAVQRARPAGRLPNARRGPHRSVGTTFRYSLSTAARVVFTIQQFLPGRRVGLACLAPTGQGRAHRPCARLGKPLRFAVNAVAGQDVTRFTGRIGGRALLPGGYQVTLIATDAGRQSAPKRLTFSVVR